MRAAALSLLLALVLPFSAPGQQGKPKPAAPPASGFAAVAPGLLKKSCLGCHNEKMASGSLNLVPFTAPESVKEGRDEWERILKKIRSGEMPPKGLPRPAPAEIAALSDYLRAEFERADRATPADPGRVTARRLNRVEYTNTIRDLLGVDFHADRTLPADDSGHGFDNIGDVLTISPLLMEKYLSAAERISARAVGADPLPKPLEAEYHIKHKTIRRLDASTVEATHRVEWDAEYVVRFGLDGQRPEGSKPVTLALWMDGKLLHSMPVETKPNGLVYFNPYSEEQIRVFLPEGDHTFRAGLVDDDYVKTLDEEDLYKNRRNKFFVSITFVGPYPAKGERASRKKVLICDPASGPACVNRIVSTLARRAYRRPVRPAEVAALTKFYRMARAEGLSAEQGVQLAIQAMLVSPHFLFRIEKDVEPAKAHPVSEMELASRLSYFLWSSMPDEELLGLAESGRLRAPGVIEGQVRRMLADPKAASLAENFAGQWLEIRNLASVKPDPQKFPEWGPELRDAMKTETRMFFESLLRENRPLSEFLDARYTFLNDRLARHYGIDGVSGPEFRRVELNTAERGGILSHASVLTVSSYPNRTSPVIRGKYVLQNILGTPPPPPPPDVPALDEAAAGTTGTVRQQLEKHRTNAVCASCHNRMDALGFGLESYDAVGKWRTADGKFPIDSSGTLPSGKSFRTPAELRTLLQDDLEDFARCLSEKMLTYSLGRGLERYDRRTVDEINRKLAAKGYPFQMLVQEIVRSLPFQSRRAEQTVTKAMPGSKEIASR